MLIDTRGPENGTPTDGFQSIPSSFLLFKEAKAIISVEQIMNSRSSGKKSKSSAGGRSLFLLPFLWFPKAASFLPAVTDQ